MKLLQLAFFLLLSTLVSAQTNQNLEDLFPIDVTSPEGVVNAFYKTLSGPPGERDWDRFRALFRNTAQINAVNYTDSGEVAPLYGSVQDYIKNTTDFYRQYGYHQRAMSNNTDYYGNMAQVFSSYSIVYFDPETQGNWEDEGIASFQLMYLEDRWWIANVIWNVAIPDFPVPPNYRNELPILQNRKEASAYITRKKPSEVNESELVGVYESSEVEVVPSFPGGEVALFDYLNNEIQLSDETDNQEATTITVQFVVEDDGGLQDVRLLQGGNAECNREILRVMKSMPVWEPGIKNLESVKVRMQLSLLCPFQTTE